MELAKNEHTELAKNEHTELAKNEHTELAKNEHTMNHLSHIISEKELVLLLHKMIDNNSAHIQNQKLQLQNEKMRIEMTLSEAYFDKCFVMFGFMMAFVKSGIIMFYVKDLIDKCATNVVYLLGHASKYGIETAEILVRNSASYAWNSVAYAGEYIGIVKYANYETNYITEGITGSKINAVLDIIVENTSLASFIVTLLFYIIITYILITIVIIIVKVLQCKKMNLKFLVWSMGVETR